MGKTLREKDGDCKSHPRKRRVAEVRRHADDRDELPEASNNA